MSTFLRILLCFWAMVVHAEAVVAPSSTTLSVWVNEAIVATYSYDYQHHLDQQSRISHYFSATGWVEYSRAFLQSKVLENVEKNKYAVSAVALAPPEVTSSGAGKWTGKMPVVVVYKNPQFEQRQTLMVTIAFEQVPEGTGVRRFAIKTFQAVVYKPTCSCAVPVAPTP